jgi:hypothetical protein
MWVCVWVGSGGRPGAAWKSLHTCWDRKKVLLRCAQLLFMIHAHDSSADSFFSVHKFIQDQLIEESGELSLNIDLGLHR